MHNDLLKLCFLVITVICCLVASNKFNQPTNTTPAYLGAFKALSKLITFFSFNLILRQELRILLIHNSSQFWRFLHKK